MDNREKLNSVSARTVAIEVTDEATGKVLRRELPIDYFENANLLRLGGENSRGEPSELVFYTGVGMGRLRDLTGGGPDKDPCGGHSH